MHQLGPYEWYWANSDCMDGDGLHTQRAKTEIVTVTMTESKFGGKTPTDKNILSFWQHGYKKTVSTPNDTHVARVAVFFYPCIKGYDSKYYGLQLQDFFVLLLCTKCDESIKVMLNEMIGELSQASSSKSDTRYKFAKNVFEDYLRDIDGEKFVDFVKVVTMWENVDSITNNIK
jgi:hypothetical protein